MNGNHAFETMTPDDETGISRWSASSTGRSAGADRTCRSPGAESDAIFAYLRTVPPILQRHPPYADALHRARPRCRGGGGVAYGRRDEPGEPSSLLKTRKRVPGTDAALISSFALRPSATILARNPNCGARERLCAKRSAGKILPDDGTCSRQIRAVRRLATSRRAQHPSTRVIDPLSAAHAKILRLDPRASRSPPRQRRQARSRHSTVSSKRSRNGIHLR